MIVFERVKVDGKLTLPSDYGLGLNLKTLEISLEFFRESSQSLVSR